MGTFLWHFGNTDFRFVWLKSPAIIKELAGSLVVYWWHYAVYSQLIFALVHRWLYTAKTNSVLRSMLRWKGVHFSNVNSESMENVFLQQQHQSRSCLSTNAHTSSFVLLSLWCAVHSVDTVSLCFHSCIWHVLNTAMSRKLLFHTCHWQTRASNHPFCWKVSEN